MFHLSNDILCFNSKAEAVPGAPRVGEWDILLDSIEFVQTRAIPLEGAVATGSIYPPTQSHKVDNQPPSSVGEMSSVAELFNKSAVSRESAYMHLKKIKQQNKSC